MRRKKLSGTTGSRSSKFNDPLPPTPPHRTWTNLFFLHFCLGTNFTWDSIPVPVDILWYLHFADFLGLWNLTYLTLDTSCISKYYEFQAQAWHVEGASSTLNVVLVSKSTYAPPTGVDWARQYVCIPPCPILTAKAWTPRKRSRRCQGFQSCSVPTSIFGDPCVGTYKYLEVPYFCNCNG